MFRFLHLADVHLDTTFLCRTEHLRGHLRQALRTAFERAIDCVLQERVDAVLIAGDLFDNERLSFATEAFLVDQVSRLHRAGIPCCYVTGNHDPGARSFRAAQIAWPDTFRYIRDRIPQAVEVRNSAGEVVAKVVGAGHMTARDQENLAQAFPAAGDGIPHIGLLHTMVTSASSIEEHDRYAPCTVDDLQRPGYRYWALGHIHQRQQVCDRSHAYYSGNLQGRTPRECGPKGGLLVELRDGLAPEVEFRAFAPTRWETLRLDDLESVQALGDLEQRARRAFEGTGDGQGESDWLLRVVLAGPCPLVGELEDADQRTDLEETLARTLDAVDVEVRTEGVTRPVDVHAYRDQPHVLGEVLALLDELKDDTDRLADLAPEALAVEADDRSAYLATLLQDLDREAVIRLLKGKD